MHIDQPEPTLLLVHVTARLVLRIALVEGVSFAGWFLDGEPATEPEPAAES